MQYLKLIDPGINKKKNQLIPITNKPIILGRENGCTIVYSESYAHVSRKHARVARQGESTIMLENLSSTNHSYVNRKAIKLSQRILNNDIISLSPQGPSLVLVFKLERSRSSNQNNSLLYALLFINLLLAAIYLFLCFKVNRI